ncbi:MAG: Glycosyltransferase [Candidatus Berkelbacteria bacterium Athens1014_28]|uniref:Glycosyltransferase n=1 Tax=Candidatus Berkelbacteria bacterium Athens1014_28 TaxID=2017145 RepID=A0A554LLE8_9BACT|nr:MAG: Glycosyltransferase [Candidatus Berkelbacteria bacterium Athens1014_28]
MRIGFLRYPKKLYESGKVLRGGSEIANQHLIDFLRSSGVEVIEFMPESAERLKLINIPAIGTPLMFQELLHKIDKINTCDLLITTNWFGAIIPEVKVPLVTIFHANASMVLDSIQDKNIFDKGILSKWLEKVEPYKIGQISDQSKHETVITISESYFANNSDRVIAVSRFLKESLVKYYSADRKKIDVVLNTYPDDWSNINVDRKLAKKNISLVCLTRLPVDYNGFVGKGADRIFELFSSVSGINKVLIASTKPKSFDKLLKDFFPDVEYFENSSRREVGEQIANTQLSFHPSRCEACQLTLIEAMMMRNVVITFPVGVAEELIENGKDGFIVNSVKEAIKIINWLKNQPEEIERIATNARSKVLTNLSKEKIGGQYLKIFQELIKKKNA